MTKPDDILFWLLYAPINGRTAGVDTEARIKIDSLQYDVIDELIYNAVYAQISQAAMLLH